ncbi:MAG: MarR family winged helix-turn-helix transcriptional regulator [Actinomycetota bacterium]|nr:MarR family winged helix-turn-helix transcriptional regulator [Actinomycetota bacterium]
MSDDFNQDLDELISLMMRMRRLFMQQSELSFEEHSTTILQFAAVDFLGGHPKSMVSELASGMRMSMSSATQLVERLVNAGFVRRLEDERDRRIIRLVTTDKGIGELNAVQLDIREKMKRVLSKISADDIKAFIRIQKTLLETLQSEATQS